MSNNNNSLKKKEKINYKKENNSAIPFFNQGMKLFDNIKQKINQEFSKGKREGFENGGILGSHTGMQNKITGDATITDSKVNALKNNLAQYLSAHDDLTKKTTEYLGLGKPDLGERNYNLFINALPNPDARIITKCVSKNTLTGLSDDNSRFLTSYPSNSTNQNSSNFSDFSKAKEACKTWAVDSNETIFALTRDENSMYNCHVGNNNHAESRIYTKPDFAYDLTGAGSTDANTGGLFANGLIGVYNKPNDSNNSGNIIQQIKSNRPYNIYRLRTNPIWGNGNGWGRGMPSNINPWWIWPNRNWYGYQGYSNYLYYFYTNPNSTMNAKIYICADNYVDAELNGAQISSSRIEGSATKSFNIVLNQGLNVFIFKPGNISGPGGLLVAVTPSNLTTRLFMSDAGDPNWGVSTTLHTYDEIMAEVNPQVNSSNPENIYLFTGYTHDTSDALGKYIKCDKFNGGDINKESITASYGRNCSNITQKPLMARYVKVKMMTNDNESWLQISQFAIWGYENGKLTNLAYKCRTNQPGDIKVKSFWYNHRKTGNNVWSNHADLNSIVDGNLKVRNFNKSPGYHSGRPKNGEGHSHDFVLFDLGASYPITKIVYYNRGDCCQARARKMQINLYNIEPPISGVNQTNDGGLLNSPITLTGALVQEFNVAG